MRYNVTQVFDATNNRDVEADCIDDVFDKLDYTVSICHQCNQDLDVGDYLGVIISDEADEEVYNDTPYERLYKKCIELEKKITELEK